MALRPVLSRYDDSDDFVDNRALRIGLDLRRLDLVQRCG